MATQLIRKFWNASKNIYLCVNNAAGQFFDFSDNTFKALGSATTPYAAATERTGIAGTGKSYYDVSLNLTNIYVGLAPLPITITAFERAGGSPAPATDMAISGPAGLSLQRGDVMIVPVEPQLRICTKTIAGTTIQITAWLDAAGAPAPLATLDPSATCTVTVYLFGSDIAVFAVDSAFALNDLGQFEAEYDDPNFTADRLYTAELAIVAEGATYSGRKTFTPVP
jgi:hypothetical protein